MILILALVLFMCQSDGLHICDINVTPKDGILNAGVFAKHKDAIVVTVLSESVVWEIDAYALARLKHLNIFKVESNSLTKIGDETFAGARKLAVIVLRDNLIETIGGNSLSRLRNLLKIDLSDNKLSSVPLQLFSQSKKLIWIDLSKNDILSIAHLVLPDKIEEFYINSNPIGEVKLSMFINFTHLTTLHMDGIDGNFVFSEMSEGPFCVRDLKLSANP